MERFLLGQFWWISWPMFFIWLQINILAWTLVHFKCSGWIPWKFTYNYSNSLCCKEAKVCTYDIKTISLNCVYFFKMTYILLLDIRVLSCYFHLIKATQQTLWVLFSIDCHKLYHYLDFFNFYFSYFLFWFVFIKPFNPSN